MADTPSSSLNKLMTARMSGQVRLWRDELVNTTRMNRLLYYKPTKASTLEIALPSAQLLLDRLGAEGGLRFFVPELDEDGRQVNRPKPGDLQTAAKSPTEVRAPLRTLERKSKQSFIETGVWTLYLALGELQWIDPQDSNGVTSPLLLVPVQLERLDSTGTYELRRYEGDSAVNPALAVKLDSDFGLTLPSIDEVDESRMQSVLEAVARAVTSEGRWAVAERAVLSTFTFAKEAMFQDLLTNEARVVAHQIAQTIALGPDAPGGGDFGFEPVPDDELDKAAPPEKALTVLDADSTQRRCIAAALDGRTFVMDGPPGSGKSQTITNMIAQLVAAGKSVLFVSEKAAALDVVRNRLRSAHLDPFVLELHSAKANRKSVAQELGKALVERPTSKNAMPSEQLAALRRDRESLSAYAVALNEVRQPLGRSLEWVLGRLAQLCSLPATPIPVGFGAGLTAEQVADLLDWTDRLSRAWGTVERGDDFLWRDLRADDSGGSRAQIPDHIDKATAALIDLKQALAAAAEDTGLHFDTTVTDGQRLVEILEIRDRRLDLPADWLAAKDFVARRDTVVALVSDIEQALERRAEAVAAAGSTWSDLDVSTGTDVQHAANTLASLTPPVAADATAPELAKRAGAMTSTLGFLQGAQEEMDILSAAFHFDPGKLTLARLDALIDLAKLAESPTPPEAAWLRPGQQPALHRGAKLLEDLLGKYNARQRDLSEIFTDDALAVDLEALARRFATAHKGMHRFGAACRADKKTLAGVTVAKRADKRALHALPQAVEWQRLDRQLAEAEKTELPLLGTRYYPSRTGADFSRLTEAIAVAQEAVRLAADDLDPEALAGQLCEHDETAVVVGHASRLEHRLAQWRQEVPPALGADVGAVNVMPLRSMDVWATTACEHLESLATHVAAASEVAGRDLRPVTLLQVLGVVERALESIDAVERRADDRQRLLGGLDAGLDTPRSLVAAALVWVEDIRTAIGAIPSLRTARRILASATSVQEIAAPLAAWSKVRPSILGHFTEPRAIELAADLDISITSGIDLLEALARQVGEIDEWDAFITAKATLDEAGLEPVLAHCIERRADPASLVGTVERAIYTAWADAVLKADRRRLSPVRSVDRDALVTRFALLDRRRIALASAEIVTSCTALRPNTTVGPAAVIRREAEKKTRHMPIKKLLAETGPVAQRLKPCFMMSPLSVSQCLPPDLVFDVVVFDEASQVRPSDAANCIYRGRQLIVAGDQKQLPPTNFFGRGSAGGDDEYEDEQFDEFSSILDQCKASGVIQSLPLQWHYRSAHESLITYSNYRFYEGRLLTFPGAIQVAPDLGIEVFKVDGTYRRGAGRDNPAEAAKVVERVLYHRQHHPDLSIGVVTFSDAQESAVDAQLEAEATKHPELADLADNDRLDGFFVKNLESVQGDERDIIIFSVGYGPDEAGKFTLQMGPLTKAGGWRRLNVAITRARKRVEVVTSVLPSDFPADIGSEGVRHLKGYLDYALRGTPALALDLGDGGDSESPFEEEVVRLVTSWGFTVQAQVGVAGYRVDIGIRHPTHTGAFVLGVECDGAMYHSSKTARDRDRLRQGVLEGLGWRLHRIWGPSWYRDRANQERRLREAIEAAVAGRPAEKASVWHTVEAPTVTVTAEAAEQWPFWAVPYTEARLQAVQRLPDPADPSARPRIRRVVTAVVETEQPVHIDRVLRCVSSAFAIGRMGHRIRENALQAVAELSSSGLMRDGDFLSMEGFEVERVRRPGPGQAARKVEEVAPSELYFALYNAVNDAATVQRPELLVYVARLFGWGRLGCDIEARLNDLLDELVEGGELAEDGERLRVPE